MFLYLLGLVFLFYLFRWVRELPRVGDKASKYVFITGCDSGFGNLLARHLDKIGFRVIAGCFTDKGEDELKKACSGNLITTHLDVTSKDSLAKVAAMIKDKVGDRGEFAGAGKDRRFNQKCSSLFKQSMHLFSQMVE